MKLALAVICGLLCLSATVSAASFRLVDSQPVCFSEDLSYSTDQVIGSFTRKSIASTNHVPVTMSVVTEKQTVDVYKAAAKPGQTHHFRFKPVDASAPGSTSKNVIGGVYKICFTVDVWSFKAATVDEYIELSVAVDHHDRHTILPKPEPEMTRQKVHKTDEVFVFTDFDGQPKETLRTHEYIQRVNTQLGNIGVLAAEVESEVKHFEEATIRMRQTTESTFDRIWVCAVLMIIVLSVVSWLEFAFLKNFLKRKKLV